MEDAFMEVSIQHVIGTIALAALTISVALAFQVVVGYVEVNVLKTQLNQVAEYVSLNIASLVSLTEFAYGELYTWTVTKDLNLPTDLSGKSYLVKIIEEDGVYYVQVELAVRKSLNAKSPIPLNLTRTLLYIVTDSNFTITDGTIKPCSEIYGGDTKALVWCEKRIINGEEKLCVGLGRRE
ncbi:MAG: hypothetical protein QXR81_05420 [Candidatus Nezhaarchaeales archaeon]